MNYPIKVAQIMGKWVGGGVETVIMNYYQNIDREKVQFDFLFDRDSVNIPIEKIEKMGGRVIFIPPYQSLFQYQKELKKVLKENCYKIVHSNINSLSVFPLHVAKKVGVPIRIAHSHSTTNKKEFLKNIVKQMLVPFSKVYANYYFACSEEAGKWLFGKKTFEEGKIRIVHNGIDLEKFSFDSDVRLKKRRELEIAEENIVVGHVGRFMTQKNHDFLVDVFKEFHKEVPNSQLLLIGRGPLKDKIENKVKECGLSNAVSFLGQRNDISEIYQAFDLFVFPSLYEGLGMVAIEAQCAGLPCILSSEVPRIAKVNENVFFLDLEASTKEWVDKMKSYLNHKERSVNLEEFRKANYDIHLEAKKLEKIYQELISQIYDK